MTSYPVQDPALLLYHVYYITFFNTNNQACSDPIVRHVCYHWLNLYEQMPTDINAIIRTLALYQQQRTPRCSCTMSMLIGSAKSSQIQPCMAINNQSRLFPHCA